MDAHLVPDPGRDQAILQQAVLELLLEQHPAQLSISELSSELSSDPSSFAEQDAIENAVRELVGVGLVHRHGGFVFPTRAAVAAAELIGP
jgi:predicted transcriptional regulator with HTH domain